METQTAQGRFVWFELMTSAPSDAVAFYRDVTGWGRQVWDQAENYTMFTAGDLPVAGVMDPAEDTGAPPHWVSFIACDDVDALTARAAELGGKVLREPGDIPTVGRFSVLEDVAGAAFCLFTPAEPYPAEDPAPAPRLFTWLELGSDDLQGAKGFYRELLGWQEAASMDMGEAGEYWMFGRGAAPLGGMYQKPPSVPGPSYWLPYVMVDDLDAAVERVRAGGGAVLNGPMEVPGGDRIAQCTDPQGGVFALHARGTGA